MQSPAIYDAIYIAITYIQRNKNILKHNPPAVILPSTKRRWSVFSWQLHYNKKKLLRGSPSTWAFKLMTKGLEMFQYEHNLVECLRWQTISCSTEIVTTLFSFGFTSRGKLMPQGFDSIRREFTRTPKQTSSHWTDPGKNLLTAA